MNQASRLANIDRDGIISKGSLPSQEGQISKLLVHDLAVGLINSFTVNDC